MDISRDEVRRAARAIDGAHGETMAGMRAVLHRIFSSGATDDEKASAVIEGLDRRGFLRVGGLSIATAGVMAACGGGSGGTSATTTTTTKAGSQGDIAILRTASSLEEVAVAFYEQAIESKLLTTTAVADVAKLFQGHHADHSDVLQQTTRDLGGEPFGLPNEKVLATLRPEIAAALTSEAAIIAFALRVERIAAATYQSDVGRLDDLALAETMTSIGSVETRHATLLAVLSNAETHPDGAFQTADLAVGRDVAPS